MNKSGKCMLVGRFAGLLISGLLGKFLFGIELHLQPPPSCAVPMFKLQTSQEFFVNAQGRR